MKYIASWSGGKGSTASIIKHLRTYHRDLWNKLLELENEPNLIDNMWNTLTKTRIHEWEERFYWEERQMTIFDYIEK